MNELIERTESKRPLWREIERYRQRNHSWAAKKSVCVVSGLSGCGKTTLLLRYFKSKNRKVFYFSFAGLEESAALRLMERRINEVTGQTVSGWDEAFTVLARRYKNILFDDIAALVTYKQFQPSFYEYIITDIHTRPFVVFLAQPNEEIKGLADNYAFFQVDYFSVPDMVKCFPKLSKADKLGICTVSGGIPKIFSEYEPTISFEENLRHMLRPGSAFCTFMPELLSKYFRRPENDHAILHAIANGSHKVSEIGKFTGFAYNKCDNYLSALVDLGIVSAHKEKMKSGAKKTLYRQKNSYFRLWYRYIYENQAALQVGDEKLTDSIIQNIIDKEIHDFHIEKAFALANYKIYWELWNGFRISDKVVYAPKTIRKGKFSYTFDAIARNGEKAVFIKVFKDANENCQPEELAKIRRAVTLVNMYYDSHVFIFSKRRFSDYAVHEAAKDDVISLVEIERLKF